MPEQGASYPPIPYHLLLDRAAGTWSDRTAVVAGEQRLSFGEINRLASRWAHGLIGRGIQRGDRVALFLPNCPEYAVTFFGSARAGAAPSPLNPSYREREVRYQVCEAGARVLVVHASLWPVVAAIQGDLGVETIVVTGGEAPAGTIGFDEFMAGMSELLPDVDLGPDALAALPFSSGTTGTSKGVMLTQRNLVCNAVQFADCTATGDQDVLLIFLPLYHIYGVALMTFGLMRGARLVLMPRFDLGDTVRLIEQEGVTQLYVVPPVMLALANAPDLTPGMFRSLRFIMSAAAPLAPDLARRVYDRLGIPVIQAYGMTETSPLTHFVPLDRPDLGTETVGRPVAGTECRIVDPVTGEGSLPAGGVGEVVVRGPQVMAGYWNAPQETARALRNGWLRTGDVGREDEERNLYIVDRLKEMIKYKAFSIAPAELEALLLEHPAVADCAVSGMPDDAAGEVPRAYVVLRPDTSVTPAELQAWVAERVAGYKQIRRIDLLGSIPRTPSGKILRRLLPA